MMDIQQAVETYKQTHDEWDLKVVIKLIEVYASNETRRSEDVLEAKSDLNYVIYLSVKNYDASKGMKFTTYFWVCYKHFLKQKMIKSNTQKRIPKQKQIYFYDYSKNDGEEFECFIPSKTNDMNKSLFFLDFTKIVSKIKNKKDLFTLIKLFEGYDLVDIAKMMGVKYAAVYNRLTSIRKKQYGFELYDLLKNHMAETEIE